MCFYCDDRHEPIKTALAGVSVLDRSLFENPPLNYARYGLYPRDILPPHKGYEKTAETVVCPFCGTNIWERDREKIKQEIKEYLDEYGLPLPRPYGKAMKEYNLMNVLGELT
jgi:hypothetical protein